ncbi:hypothetical protein FOL47_009994, partial [Perkinsus chesapeaki]
MSVARLYFFRHRLIPIKHSGGGGPVVYAIREPRLGKLSAFNRIIDIIDELEKTEPMREIGRVRLANWMENQMSSRFDPLEATLFRCAVVTSRGVPEDRPCLVVYYDPEQYGPADVIEWAKFSREKMLARALKWSMIFAFSMTCVAVLNLSLAPGFLLQSLHFIGLPLLGLCGGRALKLSLAASGGSLIESTIADGMAEFIPVRMGQFDKISSDLISTKYGCLKAEHALQAPGLAQFLVWRINEQAWSVASPLNPYAMCLGRFCSLSVP